MSLRRRVSLVLVVAFAVLLGGDKSFAFPTLPGLPSVKGVLKGAASNELLKEFGTWINLNRPVYVSGNDVLPTVPSLPGGSFHPVGQATIQALFARAHDGVVQLPPGDYNISVITYCMGHSNQGPWRNKYILSPIRGAWADIVAALNYRAAGSRFSPLQIQILSWSLQAGMGYAELSPASKQVVDALLPDFKRRLQGDFFDRAKAEWNAIASKVPGAPSFDEALHQLGDLGTIVDEIRTARDQIVGSGNNFNALVAQFSHLGSVRIPDRIARTPWSVISPGVYARLRTRGTLLTQGVLQIRVTAQTARSYEVASTGLRGLGRPVAALFGFPITNLAGFFNGPTQPLSWTPQPNNPPDPSQSGGGPDNQPVPNWIVVGASWPRNPGGGNSGGNGGGNPGNGGGNGGDDSNGDGGGGGGGNNANNGSNGGNNDNGDASSACDPPDNMFGVQKGTLAGSTPTSLVLGRGKGKGVVCLLLRPFVDMSALGWPGRGTGQVDDGWVSYNLPGQTGPGNLVVFAHYTYATESTLTKFYVKKQVTAVVEYSGVIGPCPELTQTFAVNKNAQNSTWLSGAELENRLCITGMSGQQIQVQAWVVDGSSVSSVSLTRPVNPQNFLYADFWGHM